MGVRQGGVYGYGCSIVGVWRRDSNQWGSMLVEVKQVNRSQVKKNEFGELSE